MSHVDDVYIIRYKLVYMLPILNEPKSLKLRLDTLGIIIKYNDITTDVTYYPLIETSQLMDSHKCMNGFGLKSS